MPDARIPSFADDALFQGLDEATLRDVSDAAEQVHVGADRAVFEQDGPGDAMYLLASGCLEVRLRRDGTATPIDRLEPPALLGETALITGRPRSATVVALEDSVLLRLPAAAFAELVERHPDLLQRFEAAMRPRLRRTQLAPLLHDWFGADGAADMVRLQTELPWHELRSGETLYREGDAGDSVHLVVSGRLRLERGSGARSDRVGEVAPGESTGETSMLLGRPRGATARALRDTRVVEVPREVAEAHPRVMARLARIVAERAARREEGRGRGRPPRTVALLPATAGVPSRKVAELLTAALAADGGAAIVDRGTIDAAFERAGVADAADGGSAALVLGDWLDRFERAHERLFYLADHGPSAWTDRCLRQADRILLVAETGAGAPHADAAARAGTVAPDTPLELLLIRPDDADTPSGTATWLERFAPAAHHHARLGVPAEIRSAARRIAGRGRILVLSGGGARGYVHIGLLRALEEAGIEIDAIAGTSMGALVGGGYAMARSVSFAEASARRFGDPKRLVDRTLPLLAIARTRGVTTVLQEMFGEVRIEDLPVPFFCVAADLSHALPHLFDHGPLWRAVRGSSAIPGVFTPILLGDALIVDGGVMNNFPVDLARERFGDGPLIASNAYGSERPSRRYDFPDHLSGWELLWQKALPKRLRTVSAPSILSVLTQATSLHSHYRMDRLAEGADLVVRYPTDQVGSLEFERSDELIETGYRHALAALRDWDVENASVAPVPPVALGSPVEAS